MKGSFMKNNVKIIFHIDLNAFFASVEMIRDPFLKNKVFAVGGGRNYFRSGVLTTASYKARKYGIRSAMTISEAQTRYPKLLVVPNHFDEYKKHSKKFIDFLHTYTDQVQQVSIDEAYMDVTSLQDKMHPIELAKEIQSRLNDEYFLPCSIGIAPTLFLAKMASDMKKPMGITILRKRDIKKKLYPLSVKEIHGVGAKTYPRLMDNGIHTIKDFLEPKNKDVIINEIGENTYVNLYESLKGNSSDFVDPDKYKVPMSISNETTLPYDMDHYESLIDLMNGLFDEGYERLIKEKLLCKTVFIKIRYSNRITPTRSISFNDYTKDESLLRENMLYLFERAYNQKAVRLLGVGFGSIIEASEYKIDRTIFNYQEVDEKKEV